MAVYTIELGKLLTLTGFDIGLNDYPLPSFLGSAGARENFRNALNQKILNHYQYNEICCLPPDKFKTLLNNTMNERMPYFNLLYDAMNEKWKFYTGGTLTEIIGDTSTHSTENESTNTGSDKHTGTDALARSGVDTTRNDNSSTNNNNSYTLAVSSDTPGQLLNIETDIANNTYASLAGKNKTTSATSISGNETNATTYNSTETTTHNTTDSTERNDKSSSSSDHAYNRNRTISGLSSRSYAELFKEYSESIRNLDLEVIKSVQDCFMGIF